MIVRVKELNSCQEERVLTAHTRRAAQGGGQRLQRSGCRGLGAHAPVGGREPPTSKTVKEMSSQRAA